MCDRIGCSKQYEKSKASIILSGSSWNRLLWKDHVAANQGRSQVAFRRNTFSIRNLEGFELLKGNRKRKKASHPPKPVPNSKQRLHLLHMDLCGLIRVEIINGKRYVLVIVDDYSRYTWVHFLRSKDEATSHHYTQGSTPTQTTNDNVLMLLLDGNTFEIHCSTIPNDVESSSSQYVDPSNMHMFYQPYPHEYLWTKDHPLEQVIGEPSRPVLTRNQLRTDGDMCIYALTVSIMEPRNIKEARSDPRMDYSMQESFLYFKRLYVWVVVPCSRE
ncbi:retrovirus-related pol polyprotein from transposon TNT 1-94 [Tanacetum coccineum]